MQPATLSLVPHSHDLEDLIEKARAYIHAAKSPATLRAYRTDFEDFTRSPVVTAASAIGRT